MVDETIVYDADDTYGADEGDDSEAPEAPAPSATALSVRASQPSSPAAAQSVGYSRAQLDLIKQTVAAGTSDLEFKLFVEVCRLTGLNPFARQIYAIMRNAREQQANGEWRMVARMTIQTGIDGYRLIAARTGELAGIDDPVYDVEEGDHPTRATVTVYRLVQGQRMPFTATARWREYAAMTTDRKTGAEKPVNLWAKMPWLMLGKCSEALALRKAFAAELSGVYTSEEMAQADSLANSDSVESGGATATTTQRPQASQRRSAQANVQKPAAAPTDAALPTWPELSAEAQALDVPIEAWRQQITALTGKTQRTDPKTGKTLTISAQLTDDDKRTMMNWLTKRRQQFEGAATATPPLESLQYAGH